MQQSLPGQPVRQQDLLPQTREVAPGIWKITQPIPFPLRTVNMYALVGQDGWALIDAGIGTPEARAAFTAALQRASLNIADLCTIVLTHHHPDHIGLSGELQEQSGATVYMHPLDETDLQVIWSGTMSEKFGRVSHFLLEHGLPPTPLWFSQVEPHVMREIIRVPPHKAITLVEDEQEIELAGERYRVTWTPGHSDGHICLFRERDGIFLVADHVLPRITPNVGLYSQYSRPNPLGDYLASLRKVAPLPATLILPGHGEPFENLAGRVEEIIDHHWEREAQILTMLEHRPQHAYQLSEQLFGARLKSNEAKRMAVAEVLSHLEYMRYNGKIEQQRTTEGLILYKPV